MTAALGCPRALALTQDRLPTIIGRWFPLHNAGVLAHVADLRGCRSIRHVLMGKEPPQLCPTQSPTTSLVPLLSSPLQSQSNLEPDGVTSTISPLVTPRWSSPLVQAPIGYIHPTPPGPPEHNDCPMLISPREPSVSHTVIYAHPSPHRTPLRQSQLEPWPALECPHDHC